MLFKFIFILVSIFFLLIAIILVVEYNIASTRRAPPKPAVTPKPSLSSLDVLAFVPYWDQENALRSVQEHTDKIDALGLFWYQLSPQGSIETFDGVIEDHRIIETAHANGIKVYGLIANLNDQGQAGQEWDSDRVGRVILNTQARRQHIQDLIQMVVFNNFDGLALDYESLDPSLRNAYTLFVRELAEELHKKNKSLEIAIHPKNSDDRQTQFFGAIAQDYENLARYADRLHFMMYTQHDVSSPPGPSSTLDWNETVLNYAVGTAHVPPEKIVLGIGLFGTHWVTDPSNEKRITGTTADLTYQSVEKIASENQHELVRDQGTQSMMMTFTDQDGFNIIWFDDAMSVKRRMEIARDYGLSGVSLWRLGGEDPSIWSLLSNKN